MRGELDKEMTCLLEEEFKEGGAGELGRSRDLGCHQAGM